MSRTRVGVIGVGYLGRFHAQKYAAHPDADLAAIVDSDAARAGSLAAELNTRALTDLSGLFGSVDAVSIVVPTVLHFSVARQFLERGIHVLVEKPVTVTPDEASDLIQLARDNRAILQVGHIERFNPAYRAVKQFGTAPRYITAERAAPFTERCTDVNVVLDLMIHDIDIVMDLAGAPPQAISAAGASVVTKEIDIASVRMTFPNGCIADLVASRVSDDKKRVLRAFNKGRVLHADFQQQKASVGCRPPQGGPSLEFRDLETHRCDTLNEEITAFLRSVRTGEQPLVRGEEGRAALSLATLITTTIDSGTSGFVPVP